MLPYRIYRLDDTGRIESVIERECSTDHEALAAARQFAEPDSPVEVWQYARYLGKVQA
jgi:hypothetical protein